MKKRYWLTPPEEFEKLNREFKFDFDPCPCPRPDGYNSLVLPWSKCNYVNPPFLKEDSPFGGPSAFARKAIEESKKGNTSVFVLPLPWKKWRRKCANTNSRRVNITLVGKGWIRIARKYIWN